MPWSQSARGGWVTLDHSLVPQFGEIGNNEVCESFYILALASRWRQHLLLVRGERGEFVLSSLQSRDRIRRKIGCGLYVLANRGNPTSAEIVGAANLFLSAVFSVACHGPATRRIVESGSVANDS